MVSLARKCIVVELLWALWQRRFSRSGKDKILSMVLWPLLKSLSQPSKNSNGDARDYELLVNPIEMHLFLAPRFALGQTWVINPLKTGVIGPPAGLLPAKRPQIRSLVHRSHRVEWSPLGPG